MSPSGGATTECRSDILETSTSIDIRATAEPLVSQPRRQTLSFANLFVFFAGPEVALANRTDRLLKTSTT